MKKVIICTIILIVFIVSFFLVRYFSVNPYQKRIECTNISLNHLRGSIENYKQKEGHFPESLSELKQYYENNDNYSFRKENKEYISFEQGSEQEHKSLNGKGGWCYNKETGSLIVNINKPLKDYFEKYYYFNRNEIPSEW